MRQPSNSDDPALRQGLRAIPPGLHLVSTPIGAARDITLRALDILAAADVLVAEDTRTLRHLLEIHGVALSGRPLIAHHDHSGEASLRGLLALLAEGKSMAYASEAGTPLISDPGFELARAVAAAGLPISAAPGPCAAICALTLSGLPSDRFLFAGFPPAASAARKTFLTEVAPIPATLILYESPRRLAPLLTDMARILGPERQAAICRELTKKFEDVTRGTLGTLAEAYETEIVKGEVVVLVDRSTIVAPGAEDLAMALREALQTMSVKDAVGFVSHNLGIPRKLVYKTALDVDRD
ncbi:MAG: 16S rRNA (cytidine(1402)-2'-O)-methyltransferase [Rhodobacterales bacterium 32-66-7]|nr:MAG: 16S rRNA (cytidine(1402)-2'-O)-methyltransferase [Rhodobacterales bacterium 32-66-7]